MLLLKNNLFSNFLAVAAVEDPKINGPSTPPQCSKIHCCWRYLKMGLIFPLHSHPNVTFPVCGNNLKAIWSNSSGFLTVYLKNRSCVSWIFIHTDHKVAARHTQKLPACNCQCVIGVNHELVFGDVESRRGHRKPSYQTWEKKGEGELRCKRCFEQLVKMYERPYELCYNGL